ncbi:MAG: DUF4386 domain-containing protein [Rhodobacteraceae bacterium]|nr:DUF4386 domain-containing protein [Paracoccaceae bacterium]
MRSIKSFSRLTGAVYFFIALAGVFGISYVPELVVLGDTEATINSLLANTTTIRWAIVAALLTQIGHLVLVLMLHRILAPVSTAAANLMVIFVLVGVPIAMLNEASYGVVLALLPRAEASASLILAFVEFHAYGIVIVQIFWGLWLFPFGYLIYKSDFLPKIIGVTLMIGCFGYLTDSVIYFFDPNFSIKFAIYLFWGELIVLTWLIIKGVNVEKWKLQSDESLSVT